VGGRTRPLQGRYTFCFLLVKHSRKLSKVFKSLQDLYTFWLSETRAQKVLRNSKYSFLTSRKRSQRFLPVQHKTGYAVLLWAGETLPRTFFVVATPKNFSVLLTRPILLNGCPPSLSSPLPPLQNQTHQSLRFGV